MVQNYMWKVTYLYHEGFLKGWRQRSSVFKNKLEAMKFKNLKENDKSAKRVTLSKVFS